MPQLYGGGAAGIRIWYVNPVTTAEQRRASGRLSMQWRLCCDGGGSATALVQCARLEFAHAEQIGEMVRTVLGMA